MSNGSRKGKHTHAQQQAAKAQAALKALEEDGELSGIEWEALTKELELATKEEAKAAEACASACSRGVRGTKPGTKRGTYQLKDPNAPKKPYGPSRWFSYLNRKRIKKSNPGKDPVEISALLVVEYKALSTDKKMKYADKANNDKERYKQGE